MIVQTTVCDLTVSFFENGPISTPTKSLNLTIVGSEDLDSAQWSRPSRLWWP